ncbi:coiled-coil domain-containing protein 146 [Chanos chanos]|uniref:Coiled-coil domain-containing protein 146 n=1 Tax=Chanos chanos TaxID=29144 RepID=A0A6J2V7R2_CHACN|nr:coiled-coil domain-containing protein 146 [Chanos chanos]
MSQTREGSSSLSEEDYEYDEEEEAWGTVEEPISALAPETCLQEELPSQVSAHPALQCLDEMFSLGKISRTRLVKLKSSFSLLHDTLRCSQESEIRLLQKAKGFRAELERQQQELESVEQFPEGPDTEVTQLRQKLLKLNNDLREAEDRDYQMQQQLECLQEEKTALEKEYKSQPNPDELEWRLEALKRSCEEIKEDIAQRHLEIKNLNKDMEDQQQQIQSEQQELERNKEMITHKEAELAQLLSMPTQLGKETEKIQRRKLEVEKRKALLDEQLKDLSEQRKLTEEQCRVVDAERREEMRELEGRRALLETAEREHSMLLRELEMTKEKEAVLMSQRSFLDINLGHFTVERKAVHENLTRKAREKDRELRNVQRMEQQLKLAKVGLGHTEFLYNETKAQRDAMPKDDGLLERRNDLQKEIENLQRNFIQQQSLVELKEQVEQCMKQEQALVRESYRCREELHDLSCLTLIKAEERAQKGRELLKAKMRYNHNTEELKVKALFIQEHKKQNQDIKSRLNTLAKMYDVKKSERNKFVNLIQIINQNASEKREKLKFLENNREILRTDAINKDKLLKKLQLRHVHSYKLRSSLKKDISKATLELQELRQEREEQKVKLGRLARVIDCQEQTMLQIRKSYRAALQSHKNRVAQLQKSEDEIHILSEKVNMQETQYHKRNLEIQKMEADIHYLNMLISDENRQITLCRKELPRKRLLEEESTLLQIQVSECRDQLLCLNEALLEQAQKIKDTKGKEPSTEDLIKKIEQLEERLVDKEAQLLEKELVYEQVNQQCQHICTKAENGKRDTCKLAKKVNKMQSRIKASTRSMMAVVSELSMWQAETMALQQELREKELQVEVCQQRLEQGLPPSEQIEEEWQRYLRDRRQTSAEENLRLAEEEKWSQLPSGVYTTAEPRPNCYKSTGDRLDIAKPYGAQAPFKPSEPGSNMRHFRKPQIKPIEI